MISFSCRYESCSWGVSPGNALVVSSAMDVKERRAIQNFLGAAVDQYGGIVEADVVDSNRYGFEYNPKIRLIV